MQGDQQRPAVRRCVAPECNVKCFKQDALPLNILCWLFDWGGWDFWYIQFTVQGINMGYKYGMYVLINLWFPGTLDIGHYSLCDVTPELRPNKIKDSKRVRLSDQHVFAQAR